MLVPFFCFWGRGVGYEKQRDIHVLRGNLSGEKGRTRKGKHRGSPPLWPGHFTIEIFPAWACCILGRGVGGGTLLPREECVGGNVGR